MTDKTFEYIKQAEEFDKRFPAPTLPEGFIRHDGGECPVPGDSKPGVILSDGNWFQEGIYCASFWDDVRWTHDCDAECGLVPIIAYRPDPNYVAPIDWQARAEKAEAELASVKQDRDRQYDENVSRIAAEGAAVAELATLRAKAENLAAALTPFAKFAPRVEGFVQARAEQGGSPIMPTKAFRLSDFNNAAAAIAEWEGKP